MYAVIMAGGQGTRLWPLSRQEKPKQMHCLVGDKPLLAETFQRINTLIKTRDIFISTLPEYVEQIKKILPEVPKENYILEPFLMGNAASNCLASKILNQRDNDSSAIFLPSDHVIHDKLKFLETVKFSEEMLKKYPENIITIGINPTRPDTGLGYIQMDMEKERKGDLRAFTVKRFVEKPDQKKAEAYLASWEFLWNSGMFVWKTSNVLSLYEKFLPNTYKAVGKIAEAIGTDKEWSVLKREYAKVDKTTIDYGIIEKTKDIMVIPGNFGWSDVGIWGTLFDSLAEIYKSNLIVKGHHVGVNNENCMVMASEKLIATVGLKDIIIVDTPDALLVCNRHQSTQIKELLEKLKEEGKYQYL